jgi:hypothetical protein
MNRLGATTNCSAGRAARDEGAGIFLKKHGMRRGWQAIFLNSSHLSPEPLDLDLAVLIGVCIVCSGGLISI